jgi:FkbM family methyltransferase
MLKRIARAVVPGRVRRILQKRNLDRQIASFSPRVVEHYYGGIRLKVELADPLAAGWYDHDWDLLPELEILERHRLRQGSRVFDIGAHQGVVGLQLAQRVGPSGSVVLVEPNPHNVTMCQRNAKLNGMDWVTTTQAAVSDANGRISFNQGLNGAAGELNDYGGVMEVEAVTIDELSRRFGTPDVVFVDVEGFECRALAGAAQTFAASPDWFVEVHVGCGLEAAGGSVDALLANFPPDRFQRFVHCEDWKTAVVLENADPSLFKSRFFLSALSRTEPNSPVPLPG